MLGSDYTLTMPGREEEGGERNESLSVGLEIRLRALAALPEYLG